MSWNEVVELVTRAQTGDRAAFGELVERFEPAVRAVALARLRDVHDAAELTQEVFIHAMTKLAQLREPHCFVSWLRQITVRMAINKVTRRPPVQLAAPEVLANAADAQGGPVDELIRDENRALVRKGLARLKPVDRATLEAFYLRGRTLKQMSREFETPIGTIKRRLHVARHRLRVQLERRTSQRGRRRELATL